MTHSLTFTDAFSFSNPNRKRSKAYAKLQRIDRLIHWDELENKLKHLDKSNTSRGGRKPIHLRIKIKMLFLQHCHNVSDEMLEDRLCDSIDFVGLSVSEDPPIFLHIGVLRSGSSDTNAMATCLRLSMHNYLSIM